VKIQKIPAVLKCKLPCWQQGSEILQSTQKRIKRTITPDEDWSRWLRNGKSTWNICAVRTRIHM